MCLIAYWAVSAKVTVVNLIFSLFITNGPPQKKKTVWVTALAGVLNTFLLFRMFPKLF